MPIANAYTKNAYAKDARSRQGSRLPCILGQAVVVLSEAPVVLNALVVLLQPTEECTHHVLYQCLCMLTARPSAGATALVCWHSGASTPCPNKAKYASADTL